MRIAYLTGSLSRTAGGLYHSVSGLARAVAQQGPEVAVFGGADRYFEEDREEWRAVLLRPHSVSDVYGFSWGVFRRLLSYRPDLLHLHGIWTAGSIHARIAQLVGVAESTVHRALKGTNVSHVTRARVISAVWEINARKIRLVEGQRDGDR